MSDGTGPKDNHDGMAQGRAMMMREGAALAAREGAAAKTRGRGVRGKMLEGSGGRDDGSECGGLWSGAKEWAMTVTAATTTAATAAATTTATAVSTAMAMARVVYSTMGRGGGGRDEVERYVPAARCYR